MTTPRLAHLNVFLLGVGHHEAAWRHSDTTASDVFDVEYFKRIAQLAEAAKFDSVFLADILAVGPRVDNNVLPPFEPLTLLSAIASTTSKIGLIGTASTSYNEPFTLARQFASLDHISAGRAGWNIVTSASEPEARNFGLTGVKDHALRYERADEFVSVATQLWNSWEPDALVVDSSEGKFADGTKVHAINHEGDHFRVAGPLNSSRSPQGRPLLVQAGSSEAGKELAAKYAEAVFTAQRTFDEGKAFYDDLKSRLTQHGRSRDEVKILPGIVPFIAASAEEARELENSFTDLISSDYALKQLSLLLGIDLSGLSLDAPVPDLPDLENVEGHKSRYELIRNLSSNEGLTIRELIAKLGGGRGHRTIAGTAEQVAADLIAWIDGGAADGFNIMPPYLPGGLERFIEGVLPILRERGYFRTEYQSNTLRGHYGLPDIAPTTQQSALATVGA